MPIIASGPRCNARWSLVRPGIGILAVGLVCLGAGCGPSTPVDPADAREDQASVPGPPTGVTATRGDTSATITWAAPTDTGGQPITGYVVSGSQGATQDAPPTSTSLVFTGLTNGVTYTFTVTAKNEEGQSAPSQPSNEIIPAGVPGPPTDVISIAGIGTASLTWRAPHHNGGSPLLGYVVKSSEGQEVATDVSVLAATVTNIEEGKPHTFDVVAVNELGEGPAMTSNSITHIDREWARWPLPPDSPSNYTMTIETVIDNVTGLVWQRNVPSQTYSWFGAKAYCAGLTLAGQSGWRLPTLIELESVLDLDRFDPAVNIAAFPNTPSEPFWSSSAVVRYTSCAWVVDFKHGAAGYYRPPCDLGNNYHVRCVR